MARASSTASARSRRPVRAALILRTSWVYGLRGRNFLLTIHRLAAERDELQIVADQTGTPNWARTLAPATATLVAQGASLSRRTRRPLSLQLDRRDDVARLRAAIVGDAAKPRVTPITTAEYPTPARRPAYGVLATTRFRDTFGYALPPWRDALAACLAGRSPDLAMNLVPRALLQRGSTPWYTGLRGNRERSMSCRLITTTAAAVAAAFSLGCRPRRAATDIRSAPRRNIAATRR